MAMNVGELYALFSIDTSGLDNALADVEKECNNVASGFTSAGSTLTSTLTQPIVNFGKSMYEAGTSFEAQMDKVAAIAGLDESVAADAAAIDALTEKALYMGSTTEWTATEAGQALQYMAMAGWKEEAMLAALPAVMNLATSAGSELGTTSDIVTDAMTAFGLTIQSVGGDTEAFSDLAVHFTDVLAAAATNSNTNVELLGTSFKYTAPLAGTLGMSVEDVAIALGLMANAGVKSTMSGAALRNIMTGLMGTTTKAADACQTLGVSLYNNDGTAKSLMEVMTELRSAYQEHTVEVGEVSAAVAELDAQYAAGTITQQEYEAQIQSLTENSSDFMIACVKLAGAQGLSGLLAIMTAADEDFQKLKNAMQNCNGAAAQMAATMLDNARGAVTIFESAVEGLQITLWNLLSGGFIDLVKQATSIIDSFNAMDSATQMAALKFGAVSAALGPVLTVAGKLVGVLPKIVPALSAMLGPLGVVTAGLLLFGAAAIDTDNSIGTLLESIGKKASQKLTKFNRTISTSIRQVSGRVPALVTSITNALNDVMPKLSVAASKIIVGLMDSIAENADSIVEIAQTIITNLVNGLAKAMPKLIPSAANMVVQIRNAIVNALPTIVQAGGKLVSSIIEGFQNTDWLGLGGQIVDAIGSAFASLGTVLAQWCGIAQGDMEQVDWSATGTAIINKIFSDASAGLTQFNAFLSNLFAQASLELSNTLDGQTATQMRTAIISLLTSVIEQTGNLLPQLGNVASSIVNGIAGLLESIPWDNLAEDASALGESLVGFIVKGIEAASGVAVTLVDAVASMFTAQGAGMQLVDGAATIATSLVNAIAQAIPTIAGGASNIVTAIGDALGSIDWAMAVDSLTTLGEALVNVIVAAVKGAGDIGESVVEAVSSMLGEISWDDITISLSGFVDMLANGISAACKRVTSVSTSIVQAISDLLGKVDWNAAQVDLSTFGTSIINGIATAIGSAASGATDIMNAITDLIANVDWTTLGEQTSKLGGTLINGLLEGMKNITPDLSELLSALGRGVAAAGAAIGEVASVIVSDLVSALISPDNWLKLIETGGAIVQGIATGMINLAEGILQGAANVLSSVLFGIFDAFGVNLRPAVESAVSVNVQQLTADLQGMGVTVNDAIITLFETVVDQTNLQGTRAAALIALDDLGLGDYFREQFGQAYDAIAENVDILSTDAVATYEEVFLILGSIMPEAIREGLQSGTISVQEAAAGIVAAASTANEQATAEANAAATGAAVPTELADAETRGESIVTAATEGLVTAEEVALATLADVAAITGTDATTGMANAITNGETAVTDAMDQLGSAAVEAALLQMSYATGYKAGYEYAVSIRDGLNAAVAAVRNAAAAISNTVKSNFAGILGTSSGTMIGSNFVAGIAAGINSGKADVVEAAMAVASAATGAAKMILKIRSPSRVARDEIGYMYDMGLVEGLLEGQHEVATAASNVASSLHDEFYVGDPSRETVASSTATASMTGKEVANATNNGGEDPRVLANALAEALVASGALNRVIVMDKKVVGEEIASPVSKSISNKSKSSLNGRSVQGVFA